MPADSSVEAASSKVDEKKTGKGDDEKAKAAPQQVKELGGPKGPEPTRYGDWEKGGRCSDF